MLSTAAAEGGQIRDKHSHENAFLMCSLCISIIEEMSENGIIVFFAKTAITHIDINLQR